MNKQLIKISVIVIGALVLLVLALYLMKKDQDRPGKRNSVETIGEAIADKTFTTNQKRIWPTPMKRMNSTGVQPRASHLRPP